MIRRIKQLPPAIANQIAAGEVIERPASVVKELLENAADAGASAITIEIGFGGLNQIRISDNGHGMVEEDLPLAISAHATSKIAELSDLYAIASLGFRGEALASIASISRLTIESRPSGQAHAMRLKAENSEISLEPCARNQGTTIEVCDIFFNAPVRKKFLKSEQSEFKAIEAVVKRFAMSRPQMALQLFHNGKRCLQLMQAEDEKSTEARVCRLLGKRFMDKAIRLSVDHGGLRLDGWIVGADFQLSQNDKQWVYINGRMVKDKLIHHALKQAYETVLLPGKHPACLLYLSIASDQVDVNVHPTKHEVRFQQPRLVHDFLVSQIQRALGESAFSLPYQPTPTHALNSPQHFYEPQMSARAMHYEITPAVDGWRIDQRYQLMTQDGQIYLVDRIPLAKQWWQKKINQQAFPLANRPILVPVCVTIPQCKPSQRKQAGDCLHQAGIEVAWRDEKCVVVCSIPTLLPELDLHALLEAYFAQAQYTVSHLCNLLIEQALKAEPCSDFKTWLQEQLANLAKTSTHCRRLTAEVCQDLLHV